MAAALDARAAVDDHALAGHLESGAADRIDRGSMPNVRAFKGYIPSWDGADFPVLARDDSEIRLWILDGGTKRNYANPLVRWFLENSPPRCRRTAPISARQRWNGSSPLSAGFGSTRTEPADPSLDISCVMS